MHRAHDQILTAYRAGLAHLERNAHQAARAAAAAPAPASPYKGASEQLGVRIDAAVEEDGPDLLALSHALHEDPEPGFEEHRAVSRIVALLGARGIEAEVGVHGLPTALRAQVGDGTGPTVAVLAEYDALPGIGHGCGHNIICAAGVGAFLALSRVAEDIGATVLLLGTPAEENGTGKELMARAGAFEGVDAAVMVHPLVAPTSPTRRSSGCARSWSSTPGSRPTLPRPRSWASTRWTRWSPRIRESPHCDSTSRPPTGCTE